MTLDPRKRSPGLGRDSLSLLVVISAKRQEVVDMSAAIGVLTNPVFLWLVWGEPVKRGLTRD